METKNDDPTLGQNETPQRPRLVQDEAMIHYGRVPSPVRPFQRRQIAELADRADYLRAYILCQPESRARSTALTNLDQAIMWSEQTILESPNIGRAEGE